MCLTMGQMGLSGSIVVLFVLLLRAVAVNRLPHRLFYWLWNLAGAAFLIPFRPALFAVGPFSPVRHAFQMESLAAAAGGAARLLSEAGGERTETLLSATWGAGTVLFALLLLWRWACWQRAVRAARTVSRPLWADQLCKELCGRPVELKVSSKTKIPFLHGHLRVSVLFPVDWDFSDRRATAFVLRHELTHARHLDHLRKAASLVILCLYWWDPLVWYMWRFADRDAELYCDEQVVRSEGSAQRAAYASMLLSLSQISAPGEPIWDSFLAKNVMRERIVSIMTVQKCPVGKTVLSFGVLLLALFLWTVGVARPAASAIRPQDVGVLSGGGDEAIPTVHCETYDLTEPAELKNGDVLLFGTPEAGARVRISIRATPVEGYEMGQLAVIGCQKGEELVEWGQLQLQEQTEYEFAVPETGADAFYLQNYCTDTIYIDSISVS